MCEVSENLINPLSASVGCSHIETSQLICTAKLIDWFLYEGNTGT